MFKIVKTFKRIVPLCFSNEQELICYRRGTICKLNLEEQKVEPLAKLPFSWKHNIWAYSRILTRLMRLDARYGVKLDKNKYIVVRDGVLYEVDESRRSCSTGFRMLRGTRPLNIVYVDVKGFDNAFYFGEYFGNKTDPVAIYKRVAEDQWEKVYEFTSGEIGHIHNLIPDKKNNCIWILTGDFGKAAAIWMAKNNFSQVTPIIRGDQSCRACVAFPFAGGLIYATDTPFSKNSLRMLTLDEGEWKSFPLQDINGSAVYSCCYRNVFLFSTVVENNGGEPLLRKVFTLKRGNGIIENSCFIYKVDSENKLTVVGKNAKDLLPFFLFQFGAMCFPTGKNDTEYLPVYNIATWKHDLSLVLYKLENEEDYSVEFE